MCKKLNDFLEDNVSVFGTLSVVYEIYYDQGSAGFVINKVDKGDLELTYRCNLCDDEFYCLDDLIKHIKEKHSEVYKCIEK